MANRKPFRPTITPGKWYGVIDRRNDVLVSMGTVVSDTLSDDFDVVELTPPAPGEVWDPKTRKFIEYVPTQEQLDAIAAEEARQAQYESDVARTKALRAKVGPGKPGLTPADRDELNLIMLSRELDNVQNTF